jgi:molybdenum cofactor sulfurtransferase
VGAALGDAPDVLHGLTNTAHMSARLGNDVHYLDYAGAGVYTDAQIASFSATLLGNLFGNAHSRSPSSQRTSDAVERTRAAVLRFFRADPEEYAVVFTRGATEALRLVASSFPWSAASDFVYLRSNHNSVLGIRETAVDAGATFHVVDPDEFEARIARRRRDAAGDPPIPGDVDKGDIKKNQEDADDADDDDADDDASDQDADDQGDREDPRAAHPADGLPYHLFAFPGEENFAGTVYPLEWIARVRRGLDGHARGRWLVVLDAAALAPTRRLDLSLHRPDFVSLSFYKMFGFPTGLGALLVRRRAARLMHKRYFGGGTISFASPDADGARVEKRDASARLEDGTVNFLDIVAARKGFELLEALGIDAITRHVDALTKYAFARLAAMRHPSNGAPLAEIYGAHARVWATGETAPTLPGAPVPCSTTNGPCATGEGGACTAPEAGTRRVTGVSARQGPILTFNILHSDGTVRGYSAVEQLASRAGFHIRTGCLCNPGACYGSIGLNLTEVREVLMSKHSCGDRLDTFAGRPLGAIRSSLGALTTFADVELWMQFLEHSFAE